MRKKLLNILIILILLLITSNISYATESDGGISITSSKARPTPNETFVVTISATSESGLNGINAKIEYDENILEFIKSDLKDTSKWAEFDEFPNLVAMWRSTSESSKSSDVYEITFKVKETTQKTTQIKLKDIIVSTNETEDLKIDEISMTQEIGEKAQNNNNNQSNNNNQNGNNQNNNNQNNNNQNSNNSNNNNQNNNSQNSNNSNNNNQSSNNQNNNKNQQTNINNNNGNTSNNKGQNNNSSAQVQQNKAQTATTQTQQKIPETGKSIMIKILLIAFAIITSISYILCKKYKDI